MLIRVARRLQVALFMLSVLLLFWELGWQPYARRADNRLSCSLAGSICIISGLEVYVVNAAFNDTNADSSKQASAWFDAQNASLC